MEAHESTVPVSLETVACPLCGANDHRPRISGARDLLHHLPGEFQYVCCRSCGHVFLNPRPTADAIWRYYPQDYAPYHATGTNAAQPIEVVAGRQPWYLSRPVRAVPGLRALYYWLMETRSMWIPENGCGKRALELGCADGSFLERLREQGLECVGVEPAAEPAGRARQRGFEVHIGTLESGLFPPGTFDYVFCWMVLEHLHDPAVTLRTIHEILKDQGLLVFSVPNFGAWEARVFGRFWYALDAPRHLQQFRPASLRRLMTDCGFEVRQIIHQQNLLNVIGTLGLLFRPILPANAVTKWLLRFPDQPSVWPQLAMAPVAKILAWLRQGGRLTVMAQRR